MYRMIFDYTKGILERVSFDPVLFDKELKKAKRSLLPSEWERLNNWLKWYAQERPELKQYISTNNVD